MQRFATSSQVRKPNDLQTVEGNAALNAVKAAYGAALPSAWVVAEQKCQKQGGKANR